MQLLNKITLQKEINRLASANTPFLFLVDFKGQNGVAIELSQLSQNNICCNIKGTEFGATATSPHSVAILNPQPISFTHYKNAFDAVHDAIKHGDSYLLNLTFATELAANQDLRNIYAQASAKYKFILDDKFVFFSPETFCTIDGNRIFAFPMKGTIDATVDNAEKELLENEKELREHYTIVDLIRNDLSIIATDIRVEKFRYIEKITTAKGSILQTSSKISGTLPSGWQSHFGDMLLKLLPAGSISGAPKKRTMEIIEQVEKTPRGFYTGIMGVYRDGVVDSCVNIRFIERNKKNSYLYRSGGGITIMSDAQEEYQELQTKIYVPTF